MQSTLLWLLLALAVCAGATAAPMATLHLYTNAQERGAVCNDQTPGGYYYRPSASGTSDTWVVFLQGGAWCQDEDSCRQRYKSSPELMSSRPWKQQVAFDGGLLSPSAAKNALFADAHLAFVQYCSSDMFAGNRTVPDAAGFVFRGLAHVRAAMEDLVHVHGLRPGVSRVLYAGCSAGGQGVVNTVDVAASVVPLHAALADAGWLTNLPTLHPDRVPTLEAIARAGYELWQPVLNKACVAANAAKPWLCLFSGVAMPYVKTPTLMHTEQYDAWQLSTDMGQWAAPSSWTVEEKTFATHTFRPAFFTSLTDFGAKQSPPHAVWAGACFSHCAAVSDDFTRIHVGGITLSDALERFWQAQDSPVVVHESLAWIDGCTGFNCTVGCPASQWS